MVTFEREGDIDIALFPADTINALNAEEMKMEISQIIEGGSSGIIINLKDIKYIDSSGFGLLLSLTRTAREHFCKIKFCNITPEVMKVLTMLHLHTVFTINDTLEESLASF